MQNRIPNPFPVHYPDPVDAYDRLAPYYKTISGSRRSYLESIESLIAARVPPASRTLLDVGSGDGRRARNILHRAGLTEIVLLEPSVELRKCAPIEAEVWAMRAEELDPHEKPACGRRFDVITCLWNVLGHIPRGGRSRALANMRRLLSPGGLLFVDVNHRYNVRSYGWPPTALRFLADRLRPSETNGDVVARWQFDGEACSTYGHVFTGPEMRRLTGSAGLEITERLVVDYETGRVCRHAFQGNLLYVLEKEVAEGD